MNQNDEGESVYLSIIIPAFCEEAKIGKDVRAASAYLAEKELTGEIIVVDDGSTDRTAETAKALAEGIPNLRVISYKRNRGKGYAVRTGIRESKGKYVMFADTGLCVPYEYVDIGLRKLNDGADIAIGSRRYQGAEIVKAQPLYRRLGSKVFWLVIKAWLSLPGGVTDTQCGFKVLKGDIARKLYSECTIDGFMLDIDMLCRAEQAGYKIVEFPVAWTNDSDTRYNPITGTWHNFKQLYRIWLNVGRQRRKSDV
ncbi:MAG: glycosyltransferase family 2 protein [Actinobacteria bacterium]|nr:glycosyltransferase family 2 protein [Actinomycetota bacterium]